METKSAIIHGVTILKGDIVKIKFRKLEDVLKDEKMYCRTADIICHYGIDTHMETFIQGICHAKVENVKGNDDYLALSGDGNKSRTSNRKKNSQTLPITPIVEKCLFEIIIQDPNNADTTWTLNEILIDSISVENDVADHYFSETHQLSLVLIDSVLYVNGQQLTSTDSKIYEMFEKVLSDAAIKRALSLDDEDKEEYDLKNPF